MGPTLPDLGVWVQDRGIDGADRRKYRLSYLLACINQISTFSGPLVGPFAPFAPFAGRLTGRAYRASTVPSYSVYEQ